MQKRSIYSLTKSELEKFLSDNQQPSYRAKQIYEWLYKHEAKHFSEMSNLPKEIILLLEQNFSLDSFELIKQQQSSDNTRKYLVRSLICKDNNELDLIEMVGIPSLDKGSNQLTVCVSSQIGCSMGCVFCATGQQGFSRNLLPSEIVNQVLFVSNDYQQRVSNIVVMGQGEPFLNFDNIMEALDIINDNKLVNIGARKITISTCGLLSGIDKFSDISKQYGLAVSLHSAIQSKRDVLMPGVKNFNLKDLKETIIRYIQKTNRRVSFEYILIKGFNDTTEDLHALIDYCKDILCHINLIKLNDVEHSDYKPSTSSTINNWIKKLNENGIETTLRKSRGSDIDAACGQLKHEFVKHVSRET